MGEGCRPPKVERETPATQEGDALTPERGQDTRGDAQERGPEAKHKGHRRLPQRHTPRRSAETAVPAASLRRDPGSPVPAPTRHRARPPPAPPRLPVGGLAGGGDPERERDGLSRQPPPPARSHTPHGNFSGTHQPRRHYKALFGSSPRRPFAPFRGSPASLKFSSSSSVAESDFRHAALSSYWVE